MNFIVFTQLSNIPSSISAISLSTYQLMDIMTVSIFCAWWEQQSLIWMSKFLFSMCWKVVYLHDVEDQFLTFQQTFTLISMVATAVFFVFSYPLQHLLYLFLTIFMGVEWNTKGNFVCISLMRKKNIRPFLSMFLSHFVFHNVGTLLGCIFHLFSP